MKKTPKYTSNAIKRYEKKVEKKQVIINPDVDAKLLEAINADKTPFSTLCKQLLKKHYNID